MVLLIRHILHGIIQTYMPPSLVYMHILSTLFFIQKFKHKKSHLKQGTYNTSKYTSKSFISIIIIYHIYIALFSYIAIRSNVLYNFKSIIMKDTHVKTQQSSKKRYNHGHGN